MYPHRIRLAGPWEYEILARSEPGALATGRMHPSLTLRALSERGRVTMPCRWRDCGLGDFVGTVRFTRRFGYPGRIDDYERVWLTFAGVAGSANVCLNGATLGPCAGPCEFEVTQLLCERNLLQVDIEGSGGDAGLWGEVALEVRRTAFLKNLRVNMGDALRVSGEVAGTAEGALELYVISDRRTLAYAAVEAGKPFEVEAEKLDRQGSHVVRVDLVQGASIWWTEERQLDVASGVA